MTVASLLSKTTSHGLRGVSAMWRDRRGVAAIEFAFIVPVLLCMYFITMEASQGLVTDKKVSRIGSMVADLITQTEAAKLRGVTRPAIGDLIKRGRLRSVNMFGKTLVYRSEVEGFEELKLIGAASLVMGKISQDVADGNTARFDAGLKCCDEDIMQPHGEVPQRDGLVVGELRGKSRASLVRGRDPAAELQ